MFRCNLLHSLQRCGAGIAATALMFAIAGFATSPADAKEGEKDKGKKEQAAVATATHTGTVVSVSKNKLTMRIDDRVEHSHRVPADAEITLNGKQAKLSDLEPGDRIAVTTEVAKSEKDQAALILKADALAIRATRPKSEKAKPADPREKGKRPEKEEPAQKQAKKPFLGIVVVATREGGPRVLRVQEGSPAANAGVQRGDVITAVNGKPVEDPAALIKRIASLKPGSKVTLSTVRDGEEKSLEAKLGALRRRTEKEPEERKLAGTPWLGLLIREADEKRGVVVARVYLASPAARAGIQPGDRILKVDGKKIASPQDLARNVKQLEPGTEIEVVTVRGGEEQRLSVEVGSLERFHERLFGEEFRRKFDDFHALIDPDFDGIPERSFRFRPPRLDGEPQADLRELMRQMLLELREMRKEMNRPPSGKKEPRSKK